MTYLITFSGPRVVGGSVRDGNYTLITLADKVNVLSGTPLDRRTTSTRSSASSAMSKASAW